MTLMWQKFGENPDPQDQNGSGLCARWCQILRTISIDASSSASFAIQ
jgi:hypothetical protein